MEKKENYIKNFIEQIIEKSDLIKMPKDFLEEYTEKLELEAQKRLGLALVKELSEEKILQLNKLISKNKDNQAAVNNFLIENIDDFENKATIALSDFGKEIINNAKKLNV